MKMDLFWDMFFHVIGGLGIFLLGMRYMSDGLQTVAGSKLRQMIGAVTNNRFLAVGTGTFVTALIQSSSITTVMAVGFVNSSIMTLKQAVGVIMGANIGTTMTAWILALKVDKYGLPVLGLAAIVFLFSKRERLKYIALAVLGIGMVFFGLELMKNGFSPIRKLPEFAQWFQIFDAHTYIGVLQTAAVGCILTLIVQSSSATIGITIALASQGVITFETAAALVMGENLGTTITALLAGIGTGVNARRTAYFHALFNLGGIIWITAIFQLYLPFIEWVMATFFHISDIRATEVKDGVPQFIYIDFAIASVHTIFNVTNVLVFLPFTNQIAKLLERYIGKDVLPSKHLTSLDFKYFDTTFVALEQVKHEMDEMMTTTRSMFDDLSGALAGDGAAARRVIDKEAVLDTVQHEITEFLTELLTQQTSLEEAEEARMQLRVCDELESVSDYAKRVYKMHQKLNDKGFTFSEKQKQDFATLHEKVVRFFDILIAIKLDRENEQLMQDSEELRLQINQDVARFREEHWASLETTPVLPVISTTYTDVLQAYKRTKNHMHNIVESYIGER